MFIFRIISASFIFGTKYARSTRRICNTYEYKTITRFLSACLSVLTASASDSKLAKNTLTLERLLLVPSCFKLFVQWI